MHADSRGAWTGRISTASDPLSVPVKQSQGYLRASANFQGCGEHRRPSARQSGGRSLGRRRVRPFRRPEHSLLIPRSANLASGSLNNSRCHEPACRFHVVQRSHPTCAVRVDSRATLKERSDGAARLLGAVPRPDVEDIWGSREARKIDAVRAAGLMMGPPGASTKLFPRTLGEDRLGQHFTSSAAEEPTSLDP